MVLTQDYELFFPVFSNAFELYSLATIPNWRQRCRKAACFITDVNLLPECLLEVLSAFTEFVLLFRRKVGELRQIRKLMHPLMRYAPDR